MLVRREVGGDVADIRAVHASAFADPEHPERHPVEVGLVDALRSGGAWLPELSLVAIGPDGTVDGHVVCSRARVGSVAVLGLGPVGVRADLQGRGIGSALMHAVLGAADALNEPLVALLGHADYYPRFGFRLAQEYAITPPVASWVPNFQVRILTSYSPAIAGEFHYAQPFYDL
ncbi:MAG TPA: N-acetyltransferase [Jiangellaceae bacterium]|nr:N-acetyltransferase [Jiangellaceae bacterium]